MKVLIVTVAGMSSRFSNSIGKPVVKCLYHKNKIEESLLHTLLSQSHGFDKYVIVGGYKYDELCSEINAKFDEFIDKIVLVENTHYEDYGSGYSLYLGMLQARELGADDIVFAEGDLFLDQETYKSICDSKKSVISTNDEAILANKAVALYMDETNMVHYIYDTGHKALVIDEPFIAIYNSGQVWKFADASAVGKVMDSMTDADWQGTNLVFVEKYFQSIDRDDLEIIKFQRWINCNTVDDFNMI